MHLFKDKKDYQQDMSTNISYCFSENWPPADKCIIKQNIIYSSYSLERFDLILLFRWTNLPRVIYNLKNKAINVETIKWVCVFRNKPHFFNPVKWHKNRINTDISFLYVLWAISILSIITRTLFAQMTWSFVQIHGWEEIYVICNLIYNQIYQ